MLYLSLGSCKLLQTCAKQQKQNKHERQRAKPKTNCQLFGAAKPKAISSLSDHWTVTAMLQFTHQQQQKHEQHKHECQQSKAQPKH